MITGLSFLSSVLSRTSSEKRLSTTSEDTVSVESEENVSVVSEEISSPIPESCSIVVPVELTSDDSNEEFESEMAAVEKNEPLFGEKVMEWYLAGKSLEKVEHEMIFAINQHLTHEQFKSTEVQNLFRNYFLKVKKIDEDDLESLVTLGLRLSNPFELYCYAQKNIHSTPKSQRTKEQNMIIHIKEKYVQRTLNDRNRLARAVFPESMTPKLNRKESMTPKLN